MKTLMLRSIGLGAVALTLMCASSPDVFAETKSKTKTTITVVRQDPGGQVPTACPFLGTGCVIVKVIEEETSEITPHFPGYMLSVTGTPMLVQVERNGQTVSSTATNSSITFPTGSVYEIVSSTDYPSLVGTLVNVTGVTTNSNGGFSVFFMP